MSDTSNSVAVALGLAPPAAAAPPGPVPLDDAAVARLTETHRAHLATYNPDDPSSPVFKRPDLAAQYRQRAEDHFRGLLINAGAEPPKPETPEQIAEQRFEAQWNAPLPAGLAGDIDAQLELEEALDPAARAAHVMALRKEFGNEGYDRLVAEAKVSLNPGEKMPDGALSNSFVLRNMAAYGRYIAAYERAAAARRRG
jgi:hypothetical protein